MKTIYTRPHRRIITAQLLWYFTLVALLTVGLPAPARAAGIIVHTEVIERAIELVDEEAYPDLVGLLRDYQEIVNYGSIFRDWGYTILKLYTVHLIRYDPGPAFSPVNQTGTYWDQWQTNQCTGRGIRQHSAHLANSSDWERDCATTPAEINGHKFTGATRCVKNTGPFAVNDN